jgi:uncharacterized protein
MSQENVDMVRSAYDDFNAGNVEGVLARLDQEVEWIEPGGGDAPSGTFSGPDSVRDDVLARLPEQFESFSCTVEEARDEGDTVVVTAHFTGKSKNGVELDERAEHDWEIRDGKVARLQNKVDPNGPWGEAWS